MRVVDWDKVRAMASELKEPMSIDDMVRATGVGQRTVYRWLDLIEDSGADLVRRNPRDSDPTFQIVGDVELGAT